MVSAMGSKQVETSQSPIAVTSYRRFRRFRRGAIAVETALVMPVVITLMLGVWEAGRLMQVSMTINDAAREGARLAAGGANSGTSVTVAMVQQAVRDYLTAAGFPSAAATGATIQLTNNSTHSWTDPCDALPLDAFTVTVTIPAGAAFNSLRWIPGTITGVTQLSTSVSLVSLNDAQVVVSSQLPL
jgi:Flp pilus assembly protein TadG